MDVKFGSGAFAASRAMARKLAKGIVTVGEDAGLKTAALITDMHQPLGRTAGNALEVAEALAFLQGAGDRDLRLEAVTLALAGELLALGGLASDPVEGRAKAAAKLADGSAREIFARMVAALGGPADFADRPADYLPKAAICRPCPAPRAGFIRRLDTRRIGLAVLALGGGRRDAAAAIDPAVGLSEIRGLGHEIQRGEPLALVHAADEASCAAAIAALQGSVEIGDKAPPKTPILRERIHSRQ
jgi:thymidine phosphorylase